MSFDKALVLYSEEYDVMLPRRTYSKYIELESIEEYEYTYRIAFEMLKRTKSFKKLFDLKVEDRDEKWISKAKALGLDTYAIKNEYKPSDDCLLYEDSDSFTIGDIEDGIVKLIDYYCDKNKIYKINNKSSLPYQYSNEEIDDHEVYINRQRYLIPGKDVNAQDDIVSMKKIDKDMPLKELEDDFLSTLTLKDLINFDGKIGHFWKKRPLIEDLDDDDNLSRLINFYINKDKIYRDRQGKEKVESANSLEILFNCSNFYIPCRVKNNSKIDIEYKQISPAIPLEEIDVTTSLENRFSAQIKLSEVDCLEDEQGYVFTIKDIHNGLQKLIDYYVAKKKISPNKLIIDRKKYKYWNVNKYFKDKNDAIMRILSTPDMYYIPCKRQTYHLKNKIELKKISKSIPFKYLEDHFVKTINKYDILNKEIKIFPAYSVPALKFDESTIISLPVNINLPEKELVAYIEKIKKDYDTKNTNLKHPLELIGEELLCVEKPKSIAELDTAEKKKNIADIFYIHDVQEIFSEQKDKVIRERKEEISKIQQSHVDPDEAQKTIDDSRYGYEEKMKKYKDEVLLKNIMSLTNFSKNKITIANTYINYYIKKEKYKELITGVSSKKN